jgi:exopolysaccharide biosynthesis polyprenyl glycosylphosphotransferase
MDGGVVTESVDEPAERAWWWRHPKGCLMAADLLAMVVALVLASLARIVVDTRNGFDGGSYITEYLVLGAVSLPVWPFLFARRRLYNTRFITRSVDEFRRVVQAVAGGAVALMVAGYLGEIYVSRGWPFLVFLFGVTVVWLERTIARRMFDAARFQGRFLRPVVIVGGNAEGVELAHMLGKNKNLGYEVVGFVDDRVEAHAIPHDRPLLGTLAQTIDAVRSTHAKGVIIAATAMDLGTSNRLIRQLTDAGIHVELSSTLRDIAPHRLTVRPLGRFPIVYVEPVQRVGWRSTAKRSFDVVVASAALLITFPLLAIAAIAIKLTSPGPVVFRQERVGRDGKPFKVMKLRTMVKNAEDLITELSDLNEADGPLFKIRNDPRITTVGRVLRKTSMDELPQLWNVLHGEMSLVGPRPALPNEVSAWHADLHQRLRVQPGITGMWQVYGRSNSSFEDYERLDLYYVDNWSLVTDLVILFKTIPAVLMRRGAF